jgi:hypothetical protein
MARVASAQARPASSRLSPYWSASTIPAEGPDLVADAAGDQSAEQRQLALGHSVDRRDRAGQAARGPGA